MAKHHDFSVMVDFHMKYDQQFEFYCKSYMSAIFRLSSKTQKRFTQNKKEVRLHYSINGNFAETAKVFGINGSTGHYQSSSSTR